MTTAKTHATHTSYLKGSVTATLLGPDGSVKSSETTSNIITAVGDQWYAGRAALTTGLPAPIVGMKLGTNNTPPAKTGAGAALGAYLTNSHRALDGDPTVANGVVTFSATWTAGSATSANPITEVVLVNDATLTDATSSAANTIARVLIANIPAKGAEDTLIVEWTHSIVGAA